MHNLTDPFASNEETSGVQANEYITIANEVEEFFDSVNDEDILGACQLMVGHTPSDFRMKHLDNWHKKLERWSKVISYYKRQTLYTYSKENGRGGVSGAGEILGVTRQRAHTMYQEAEAERLAQFTPKQYCE